MNKNINPQNYKGYKFSNPVKAEELEFAYTQGLPRLDELQDGVVYKGRCRNSDRAMWVSEISKFVYIRTKFGSRFLETINHPANDNGFDLFLATSETVDLTEDEKKIFDRGLPSLVSRVKNP